jgi:hypothetical protein
MTAFELAALHAWLLAEMDTARTTAREQAFVLADLRRREGQRTAIRASHAHCSAIARLCALGEVLNWLDNPPKIG